MKRFFSKLFNKLSSGESDSKDQNFNQSVVPSEAKSISEILGDKIIDIKMFYESQGENGWLDTVLTYIVLEKNGVINFPFSGALDFDNVTIDTRAEKISERALPNIIGQTINDLYYEHDEDGEPAEDWFAFIELSNCFVIHENRMAPHGTGAANLFLYTKEQFEEKLESEEYNLRSLKQILSEKQDRRLT